jgi:hypothetical protein
MNDAKWQASGTYQIEVQGKLDESWAAWLDGMTIARRRASDGTPVVVLTGPVANQAALRGLLAGLWDLNLAVIAVRRIALPDESEGEAS